LSGRSGYDLIATEINSPIKVCSHLGCAISRPIGENCAKSDSPGCRPAAWPHAIGAASQS
jgi:hypothetical protein